MSDKQKLWIGIALLVSFVVVLIGVLGPVWNGRTGLEVADDVFNSLAKNSAYYIPKQAKNAKKFEGKTFEISLKTKDAEQAAVTTKLFESAGADVAESNGKLKVSGDLGLVMKACLADADAVYKNNANAGLAAKYGAKNDRDVIYYWYDAVKQMQKKWIAEHGKEKEALLVKGIAEKALEPTYNFYGIHAKPLSAQMGITIFLLVFYFIYTIWYGFGILFCFEGLGIVAHSGGKHEA